MRAPHRDILLFIALFLVILLLHWPAREAGFVTDFTGLWAKMQGKGLSDALASFGFPSLMPLLNVMYLALYKLFGLSGIPWLCFFVTVYSLGLVYFAKSCSLLLTGAHSHWLVLATLLLIIFSPYQVEAVIWKVGLGHLAGVSFFMVGLYYGLKSMLLDQKEHKLGLMSFALAASLFCFEWALVFPAILLLLGWYLKSSRLWKTLLLSVAIVSVYLILTRVFIGKVVGHYDLSLSQITDLPSLISTTIKYWLKHLGLVHYYTFQSKEAIYNSANLTIVRTLFVLLVAGAMYLAVFLKKPSLRLTVTIFLCALTGLLLVAPWYFSFTLLSENDRYGSLFVPFFSFFLVLLLSHLNRYIAILLFSVFLVANIFFQQKMIQQWKNSSALITALTDSFPTTTDGPVLLVNVPDNYNGTFMFRDYAGGNPFEDHLEMYGLHSLELDFVVQYNIPSELQAASASWKVQNKVLTLTNKEWGSWWWSKGLGASSYQTDRYAVKLESKKLELTLKDNSYYKHILFCDGERWQELP